MSLAGTDAGSTSSKLSTALALFNPSGKKGSGKGSASSGTTPATDAQAQQKRDASARQSRLSKAPAHVKAKWDAICALKGRDRSKNAAKSKFTEMILKDGKFEDAYWQQEVSDTYTRSEGKDLTWKIRQKVETEHGGGEAGKASVQSAIDIGIYKSRFIKAKDSKGKMVTVEEVAVCEDVGHEGRSQSYKEKCRAGGQSNEQEFRNKLIDTFGQGTDDGAGSSSQTIPKRPAASDMVKVVKGNATKAIEDNPPPKKKPASKQGSPGITEEQKQALDAEQDQQNSQLNLCVTHSIKMLGDKNTKLLEAKHQFGTLALTPSQKRIVEAHEKEIDSHLPALAQLRSTLETIQAEKKGMAFTNEKIDKLNEAGELINEITSTLDAAKPFLKVKGQALSEA